MLCMYMCMCHTVWASPVRRSAWGSCRACWRGCRTTSAGTPVWLPPHRPRTRPRLKSCPRWARCIAPPTERYNSFYYILLRKRTIIGILINKKKKKEKQNEKIEMLSLESNLFHTIRALAIRHGKVKTIYSSRKSNIAVRNNFALIIKIWIASQKKKCNDCTFKF